MIYRNFIEGAGERGIGVGYPGGFNIAWNADHLNLAVLWRGAFIDAARHWHDRGGGAQPPLGYDVCRIGGMEGAPFAVLGSPTEAWPKAGKDEMPQGYAWKGYSLDAKRNPVFHYEWMGAKISEHYEAAGNATTPEGQLTRTVQIEGALPANAFFKAASGSTIKPAGKGFEVDSLNHYLVQADGAQATQQDVLIPARPLIKVTYAWPGVNGQTTTAR